MEIGVKLVTMNYPHKGVPKKHVKFKIMSLRCTVYGVFLLPTFCSFAA